MAWYRRNARKLPWRETLDPYAIWVSEIMLQQTQVATVLRYYARFLAALATIADLATASEHDVLRLWEGLGYYRRARQMHKAAQEIVAEHGGLFPREPDAVRRLPGIGRYTAGAILSIAFDARLPILEANTIRLLSRLLAFRGDPASGAGQALLWRAAEALLPKSGSGELNQALMEVGSLICTPRSPRCGECPLESLCPTNRDRLHARIPSQRRQPVVEEICEAAVIVIRRGAVLLRKCPDGERWAGLWDFPRFALKSGRAKADGTTKISDGVRTQTGVSIARPKHFVRLRHSVTRFRITLECFVARTRGRLPTNNSANLHWIRPEGFEEYPLSTTGRKLARLWRERATSR